MKILNILILIFITNLNLLSQDYDLNRSMNSFSIDVYKSLKDSEKNFIISPLSFGICLSMTYEGSNELTQKQFENLFHYSSCRQNEPGIRDYIAKTNNTIDSLNFIRIANSIWIQNNYNINPNYKNILLNNYKANVYNIDFGNSVHATQIINNWVSNNTNGLIKDIINPNLISDNTKMILANAIYLSEYWLCHFDKRLTQKDNFYDYDKIVSNIYFMHLNEVTYKYYKDRRFEAILIPYQKSKHVFIILLPKKKDGLNEIEDKLNNDLVESILEKSKSTLVNLSIPKIKLENNYYLKNNLESLGLTNAFSDDADFLKISPGLKIKEVIHKTFFEIDEDKTVAAASTVVIMDLVSSIRIIKPKPITFDANHPFIFLIADTELKNIIFIGRYIKGQ